MKTRMIYLTANSRASVCLPLANNDSQLLRVRHTREHLELITLVHIHQTGGTKDVQRAHQGLVAGYDFGRGGLQARLWRNAPVIEIALGCVQSRRRIG